MPQPDYAALARQFGGTQVQQPSAGPDLAQLAQQFGGQKVEAATPPPAEPDGPVTRFAKGAWQNINPLTGVEAAVNAVAHPLDTGAALLGAQVEQFKKAKADYDQGHYSEMVGHAGAGLLPLLGPAAARAGETIGQGDIAGGLGQGVGLLATVVAGPKGAAKAGDALEGAAEGTGNALRSSAERLIESNVKPRKLLREKNPNVNFGRVILDEGFKPSAKGEAQAANVIERNAQAVDSIAARHTAAGQTLPIDALDRALQDLRDNYLHNPAGAENVAAVESKIHDLNNNSIYSREKFKTVYSQQPTGVLDAQGNPVMRTVSQQVPDGRELVPQTPSELQLAKRNIYADNPHAYGLGDANAARTEAGVVQARELKGLLDQAMPEAIPFNERQAQVIPVRTALRDMAGREANKYPVGLLDFLALSTRNPLGAAILLKHPITAFPIARGLNKVGTALKTMAPAAPLATAATLGGKQIDNALRRPTMSEVDRVTALLQQHGLAQ